MKKIQFLESLIITCFFTITTTSFAFSDTNNYQYQTSLDFLQVNNIVIGYTDNTFQPDKKITRAEFLKIILEANQVEVADFKNEDCFVDSDLGMWYNQYLCYAKDKGIVNGYGGNLFAPNQNIIYVEALKILYKVFDDLGEEEQTINWYAPFLVDVKNRQIHLEELQEITELTRGEMGELIYRFLDKKGLIEKKGFQRVGKMIEIKVKEKIEVNLPQYELLSVVDGDTVKINYNGQKTSIRMIGIDAPESNVMRFGYAECFGKEAKNHLKDLLAGCLEVGVEIDDSQGEWDKYDRLLAYVFIDDKNINQAMIADGYAWEYTYNLPYKYMDNFKEVQNLARSENLGLWNEGACNGERKAINGQCMIKGNISFTTGEKIYHILGCESYKQTRISESKGERWFCSEEEAELAGWRKAENCP